MLFSQIPSAQTMTFVGLFIQFTFIHIRSVYKQAKLFPGSVDFNYGYKPQTCPTPEIIECIYASRPEGGRGWLQHILNRGKGLPAGVKCSECATDFWFACCTFTATTASTTATATTTHEAPEPARGKFAPKSKRYGEVISRTFWSWQLEFPEQRMHQPAS